MDLGHGVFAFVDVDDYEKVKGFVYHGKRSRGTIYAVRDIYVVKDGKTVRRGVYLHWDILHKPARGRVIDHVNQNGLDNRKINLRDCSKIENEHNQRPGKRNKSGYAGVFFREVQQIWDVSIGVKGKRIYLGHFPASRKNEAVACRLAAEAKYYGDYAPKR